MEASLPAWTESAPSSGSDGPLLDHGELRRQRASVQQHGEVVGASAA